MNEPPRGPDPPPQGAARPAPERIMVCVGPSPGSARLVRAAARLASSRRCLWVAAYADTGRLAATHPADRERLEAHLALAESLGGEVVRLSGSRAGRALLEYAGGRNVTLIVIGKPTHPRLRDLVAGSLLDEVVRGSGDIDVQVISGDVGPAPAKRRAPAPRATWPSYLWTAGLVALASGAGALGRAHLAAPDFVMLYLLAIGTTAALFGRGPSLFASGLSVAAYNFFFVPPFFTLAVANERHLLTFAMMFVVGLLISGLTLRIRSQAADARAREERTATLYALSRDLGSSLDQEQAALVIGQHAAELFKGSAVVLLPDGRGSVSPMAKSGPDVPLEAAEQNAARWAFEHARLTGLGTQTVPEARVACMPLKSGLGLESLGVLAIAPAGGVPLGIEQRHLLEAFARQSALALERARLAEAAKAAALRVRAEEMRSSLLSAVSHDLRTPLAAITGAATTLREARGAVEPAQLSELLDTICEEAERLERLVRNLLDMTRLESGTMQVKRDWISLEEVVGAALTRLEARLGDRPIHIELPADLPLLSADPVLLELVFINLLENAAKYTPAGSPIDIQARPADGALTIKVADRGPGLPEGGEARVFEKFFRGRHAGVPGAGLGLAICRGVVEVHGGTIVAENRPGGGALFRLSLPLIGTPPGVPAERPL